MFGFKYSCGRETFETSLVRDIISNSGYACSLSGWSMLNDCTRAFAMMAMKMSLGYQLLGSRKALVAVASLLCLFVCFVLFFWFRR